MSIRGRLRKLERACNEKVTFLWIEYFDGTGGCTIGAHASTARLQDLELGRELNEGLAMFEARISHAAMEAFGSHCCIPFLPGDEAL